MKLLLDTHAFLWFVWNHKNLSSTAQTLIADPLNTICVSAASHWEIAIKVAVGKLRLTATVPDFIDQSLAKNRFLLLPIEATHSDTVSRLPLHHRDPFDRLLVAQAAAEHASVVSNDTIFDQYGVRRLW